MAEHAMGPTLRQHVVRLRDEEIPRMADEAVAMVLEVMPGYLAGSTVTPAELHDNGARNLEHVLAELLGEESAAADPPATSFYETGRSRAQQRVPLESVLYSFRIGARVLWQALVWEVGATGDDDGRQSLLAEAVVVWDVMDVVSTVVARGYRDEQARLLRRGQHRREAVLAALLDGRTRSATAVADAAEELGMPTRGPRIVVATVALDPTADRRPEELLAESGMVSVWTTYGTRLAALVGLPAAERLPAAIDVLADALPAAPVAVSAVFDDLEHVAEAHRQATLALRTLPPDHPGVVRAGDRVLESLLVGNPEVARLLVADRLGGLLAVRPADRDVLLETITALVECGGSAGAAADRLFCHRNTVVKRARRIGQLTGADLGDLASLVPLYLAALAVRTDPGLLPTAPHA